jgi:hypothetical protein
MYANTEKPKRRSSQTTMSGYEEPNKNVFRCDRKIDKLGAEVTLSGKL